MNSNRNRTIRRSGIPWMLVVLILGLGIAPSCGGGGGGGGGPTTPTGPFDLMFSLDGTFQGPHGGQPIAVVVIRSSDGAVIANANGTVSPTQVPAFSFDAGRILQAGANYELDYWIDSNFGGGTPGTCDPKGFDHQWRVRFISVAGDIDYVAVHDPSATTSVCANFN